MGFYRSIITKLQNVPAFHAVIQLCNVDGSALFEEVYDRFFSATELSIALSLKGVSGRQSSDPAAGIWALSAGVL